MHVQDIKARQRATLNALIAERRKRSESRDDAAWLALEHEKSAEFTRFLGRPLFWFVAGGVLALVAFGWHLRWWGAA